MWGHPKESDRPDAVGLAELLTDTAAAVETVLDAELPSPAGAHAKLFEAMRYSILGGGKRLRAFLLRSGARLAGADDGGALLSTGVYIAHLSYPGGVQMQRLLYLK